MVTLHADLVTYLPIQYTALFPPAYITLLAHARGPCTGLHQPHHTPHPCSLPPITHTPPYPLSPGGQPCFAPSLQSIYPPHHPHHTTTSWHTALAPCLSPHRIYLISRFGSAHTTHAFLHWQEDMVIHSQDGQNMPHRLHHLHTRTFAHYAQQQKDKYMVGCLPTRHSLRLLHLACLLPLCLIHILLLLLPFDRDDAQCTCPFSSFAHVLAWVPLLCLRTPAIPPLSWTLPAILLASGTWWLVTLFSLWFAVDWDRTWFDLSYCITLPTPTHTIGLPVIPHIPLLPFTPLHTVLPITLPSPPPPYSIPKHTHTLFLTPLFTLAATPACHPVRLWFCLFSCGYRLFIYSPQWFTFVVVRAGSSLFSISNDSIIIHQKSKEEIIRHRRRKKINESVVIWEVKRI